VKDKKNLNHYTVSFLSFSIMRCALFYSFEHRLFKY